MDDIAKIVTKQLHLDMLGFVEEALDEDRPIAKSRLGFRRRSLKGVFESLLFPHHSHASTTTAKSGLDDDWEAILIRKTFHVFILLNGARGPWNDGHIRFHRDITRRDLVSKGVDHIRRGADKLAVSDSKPLVLRERRDLQ